MSTLMQASNNWATRPSDERFVSLTDMLAYQTYTRDHSRAKVLSSRGLSVAPIEGSLKGLVVQGPNGVPVAPTHWAFNQLATLAKTVNATDLRKLPGPLAADCLNWGLQHYQPPQDVGALLFSNGTAELRAITGPNYGRVWNATITKALVDRFGDGVTGNFKVPGEFGRDVEITKQNTTLYSSDRDMFVFLADEKHRIEIPNRRDGKPGSLARGFFVWNSEVGKCTLGVATFLFDYVCCNRIVWGAEGYEEISIRHTKSAPDKFMEEVEPALLEYANSSTVGVVQAVTNAQKARIDDVDTFLKSRKFTNPQVAAIKAAHMNDEQRPIETLWDAATAVTAYARGIEYQDARVEIETMGGEILSLAE